MRFAAAEDLGSEKDQGRFRDRRDRRETVKGGILVEEMEK